jgi:DHA2 family multidrug resistance protein
VGPLIGGPLIDHFGWRSVFLINLPIGIIGLLMALAFVKESVSERKSQFFDWWGAITLGAALSAVVLVLDKGLDWGWFSVNSVLCYLVMIVSFWVFLHIERTHPEPIIDLHFFKNSVFVNALTNNFVAFMGIMGSVFMVPIFAQEFLGLDATGTGFIFIPMAFALLFAAPIGAQLVGKVSPSVVIFWSTLVGGIGIFFFTFLDPRSTIVDVIVPMAIMAFGLGFGMAQRTSIITLVVPPSEMGVASGILALVRNVSGAFGVALFATLLNSSIESNVLSIASHSFVHGAAMIGTVTELIILKAQVAAYDHVFLIASLVTIFGAFTSLFMRLDHQKRTDGKGDEPAFVEA